MANSFACFADTWQIPTTRNLRATAQIAPMCAVLKPRIPIDDPDDLGRATNPLIVGPYSAQTRKVDRTFPTGQRRASNAVLQKM